VAGASIPYPVNYIINFIVVMAFAIVILTMASYRYYKYQAARAHRRLLTGRQCLSLNMKGVKGHYPPRKVERLIKLNEERQLREAEAAEQEYEINKFEARDRHRPTLQENSELRSDEQRKSTVVDKPGIDVLQDRAWDSAPKVPAIPDKPNVQDARTSGVANMTQDVGSPIIALVEHIIVPTFVLPDEQNAEIGEDIAASDPGTAEGNKSVLPNKWSVGQSQNNATKQDMIEHNLLPEVTSATKATQTFSQEQVDLDPNASSTEGSFDDSVVSL